MINFKDEIQKYKPILEVEHVEDAINSNEITDLLEVLQYLSKKMKTGNEA